jgi:hypothetical protein
LTWSDAGSSRGASAARSSARRAGSSASAPSERQTWRRTVSHAQRDGVAPSGALAQSSRDSASGLNGWRAGVAIGMPARWASQWTWRNVHARFGSISAGPFVRVRLQQRPEDDRPVGDAV